MFFFPSEFYIPCSTFIIPKTYLLLNSEFSILHSDFQQHPRSLRPLPLERGFQHEFLLHSPFRILPIQFLTHLIANENRLSPL